MALIEFKDKPNTTTPLNATNLNNNFNELNRKCNQLKGVVLFNGNFRIGETKTITNLQNYDVLEFYYSRGRDYGGTCTKAEYSSAHTSATIIYVGGTSGTYWNKRTATIYWSENNVEFRSILEENTSGSSVITTTNNYDNLYKIIGYKL